MLPPQRMLAKKNSINAAIILFAFTLMLAGCTPAGPSALLKGKKLLDRGDYAGAVTQLQTATTLLATNAQAWNYYGVALQLAGRPDEAATAYQTALKFDRDLMEAHFNLGSLSLEQGRPEVAKSAFAAYTLRRQNDAAGWLKLGTAQLKLNEVSAAERSFSTVLALKQFEPEAYNSLGLARVQRNLPREAEKFFAQAVRLRPDYAAAILNLATVNQQHLRDSKAALENYKKYLTLTPRPADWEEVNSLVAALEPPAPKPSVTPTPPPVAAPVTLVAAEPKPEIKPQPKPATTVTQKSVTSPKPVATSKHAAPIAQPVVKPAPEVVSLKREELVVAAAPATKPVVAEPPPAAVATTEPPLVAPMPAEPPRKTFFGRLFGGSTKTETTSPDTRYRGQGLTPLPGPDASETPKPTVIPAAKPLEVSPPAPVFARYNFLAPRKPVAGDRKAASGAFTQARLAEQDEKWPDALLAYQQAATLDASWFEAQYNAGVIAHRLNNYLTALPRYEYALAIQPDSADARYNFALALKSAGFAPDAAEQLKKILATDNRDVRAHLALANLCAQLLREKAVARQHYLKVLELDPRNPQASDIRFWLSANPD